MRSLITAALTLFLFISGWQVFLFYAEGQTDRIVQSFESQVMPALEAGDWKEAEKTFCDAEEKWKNYTRRAHYFLDNTEVNDADKAFGRTLMYIKAEDLSNSSGELLSLKRQLTFLCNNEKTTLQNIL